MKLQDKLWNKYGESLDERSLTICSGTDYINVNYQHIVCPDAETAKVSMKDQSQFFFPNSLKKLNKFKHFYSCIFRYTLGEFCPHSNSF